MTQERVTGGGSHPVRPCLARTARPAPEGKHAGTDGAHGPAAALADASLGTPRTVETTLPLCLPAAHRQVHARCGLGARQRGGQLPGPGGSEEETETAPKHITVSAAVRVGQTRSWTSPPSPAEQAASGWGGGVPHYETCSFWTLHEVKIPRRGNFKLYLLHFQFFCKFLYSFLRHCIQAFTLNPAFLILGLTQGTLVTVATLICRQSPDSPPAAERVRVTGLINRPSSDTTRLSMWLQRTLPERGAVNSNTPSWRLPRPTAGVGARAPAQPPPGCFTSVWRAP